MNIAMLVDANGNAIPFGKPGTLRLFNHEEHGWKPVMEFTFSMHADQGFAAIRRSILDLAARLGDCRTLLVGPFQGFPRSLLLELGFSVWTVEGAAARYLDQIMQRTAEARAQTHGVPASQDDTLGVPTPSLKKGCCSGVYMIDLIKVQAKGTSHNSKDILLPFFEKSSFSRLDIICDHVPKWFANELASLKLGFTAEPLAGGRMMVAVQPDGCAPCRTCSGG
ncbi:MAG: Fe-only nitrogenase accessory protein AnfO [Chlorobiaceae bacterium]|nr:Fe-only nitrogenase accessory protein AnfO [Chlorobiaceae bacterium]